MGLCRHQEEGWPYFAKLCTTDTNMGLRAYLLVCRKVKKVKENFDFHNDSHFPVSREIASYVIKKVGVDDSRGFFAFIKAAYEKDFDLEPFRGGVARCDIDLPSGKPMPTDFHTWDEETQKCSACGSTTPPYATTKSHIATLSNSKTLRMPIQSMYGFVTYIETDDSELENEQFIDPQNCARTLQELFRLILEWDYAYTELDSKEEIAQVAHDFLADLSMPESIKSWLWSELPPMRLSRFLMGDEDARQRPDISQIPNMTQEFEDWCISLIVDRPQVWGKGQP